MIDVLIASYLEPNFVDQVRRINGVRVTYEPALLPRPRYLCDHVGHPLQRTSKDEQRLRGYLADAEVLFDFDHTPGGVGPCRFELECNHPTVNSLEPYSVIVKEAITCVD